MNSKDLELLSPAGDYDCLKAAINAGADAVYLGLKRFSARANAANLSPDELIRALDTAHVLGRKIYLTVNTLFKDDELDDLYDDLYEPYIHGLDGVIVQDIGAMIRIKQLFPDLPIHVSTQAAVTSADGALYLKKLGAERIVPARELSLYEIRLMHQESSLDIECFIHGSLCYSYSGKCLMSSFIGGRSGNRGRCAGPCRLPYDGAYPLSLKDLCVVDMIPELADAGISSFKIEGRMKNSAYVYGVTKIYRKYIDMYYSGRPYEVDPNDKARLISYYTRGGNCSGYYKAHNSRKMITVSSPSYITDTGEAEADIGADAATEVDIKCELRAGQSVVINLKGAGYEISVDTMIIPERSINRALTAGDVTKQLTRTGGTDFVIKSCDIDIDGDLFLPNGRLNEIRRTGLGALSEKILSGYMRKYDKPCEKDRIKPGIPDEALKRKEQSVHPQVRTGIISRDQIDAAASSEADGIIVPLSLFMSEEAALSEVSQKLYISLPYIVRDEAGGRDVRSDIQKLTKRHDIAGFYISNFESARILEDFSYDGEITADIHMYAYNREAYEHFCSRGIRTTVPIELNRHELKKRGICKEDLVIYGKIPMMIAANCLYNTKHGCRKGKDGHTLYLTDRRGAKLYTVCDCKECVNIIYNSVPISISDEKAVFETLSPSVVRLLFTDEDPKTISDVISRYYRYRNPDGSTDMKLSDEYTKGHLNRGVQ